MIRPVGGWIDGWMGRRMDGWMEGGVEEQMDGFQAFGRPATQPEVNSELRAILSRDCIGSSMNKQPNYSPAIII